MKDTAKVQIFLSGAIAEGQRRGNGGKAEKIYKCKPKTAIRFQIVKRASVKL